jgi:multiple sugar transport system permease protein
MQVTRALPLRSSRARRRNRNLLLGLLFISPWLMGFTAFGLYPIVMSMIFSFSHYDGLNPPTLTGLRNYANIVQDPLIWLSLGNTFYYAIIAIPLGTVLAILVAALMNRPVKGQGLFRTIIYVPYMVPTVAAALLWIWLLDPNHGLINALLQLIHIPGPAWLSSTAWSKPALILMAQWGLGQAAVIYLSGMQSVPKDLYESAEIDGAGPLRRFISVTIPMMSPVILYNLIMALIGSLQYFTQAYVMTSGGPANSTLFYNLYLYQQAFGFNHFGYASAMAWLLLLLTASLTGLVLRTSRRWVYYGGA